MHFLGLNSASSEGPLARYVEIPFPILHGTALQGQREMQVRPQKCQLPFPLKSQFISKRINILDNFKAIIMGMKHQNATTQTNHHSLWGGEQRVGWNLSLNNPQPKWHACTPQNQAGLWSQQAQAAWLPSMRAALCRCRSF